MTTVEESGAGDGEVEERLLELQLPDSRHSPLHHALLHPSTMQSLRLRCDDLISLHSSRPSLNSPTLPLCLLHAWPDCGVPPSHVSVHPSAAAAYSLASAMVSVLRHSAPTVTELSAASAVDVQGWPIPLSLASSSPPSPAPSSPTPTAALSSDSVLAAIDRQLRGRAVLPRSFSIIRILCQAHLIFVARVVSSSVPAAVTSATAVTYTDAQRAPLALFSLDPPPSHLDQVAASFPVEWAALRSFIASVSASDAPSSSPASPSLLHSLRARPSSLLLWGGPGSGKSFLLSSLTPTAFPTLQITHLHTRELLASPSSPSSSLASFAQPTSPPSLLVLHDAAPLLGPSSAFPVLAAQLHALLASGTVAIIASSSASPTQGMRWDREVGMRLLSREARRAVLTWTWTGSHEEWLERVVDRTHGFTAGMLVRACRHAALLAVEANQSTAGGGPSLRHWLQAVDHVAPPSSDNTLLSSCLSVAATSSEPSIPLSLSSPPADLFPHVGGYADIKKRLAAVLQSFLHPSSSSSRASGVLLQGASGTGKSLLASSIASLSTSLSFSAFHLHLPSLLSPYLGESERAR